MMRQSYLLTILVGLAVLAALSFGGCKNPDDGSKPVIPPTHPPGGTGDPIEPPIPEPFNYPLANIADIGIEGDGDVVFCTEAGMELFTAYGLHKKVLSGEVFVGIATSNQGQVDTGRGVMAISPSVNDCRPSPSYDDQYVTGGVPHVTFDAAWWGGEPDPYNPNNCIPIASTSPFESCQNVPHGISYHPETAFLYQKVYAPACIADSECPWPYGNQVPYGGYAILAYHPDAPLPPDYMSLIFEGGQDFLVYYDYPDYNTVQIVAGMLGIVPACQLHNLFLVWDWTTPNLMSSRSGMTAQNIADFEFDSLNRLIMAMPNADSVAITDPVIFGQPIAIQKVLGGRQNGMGTLPGEFQGPTAVAIDPRNQDIYVSDTGNHRVQIFDNDGNFIREFGSGDSTFNPRAIRVDAFGAIYVANVGGGEGNTLRIFNQYGSAIQYGTIEGWVFDKVTHQPIDDAIVRINSTFLNLAARTDNTGYFKFPAVPAGTHDLVAEKYAYNSGNVSVTVTGGYKTLVDIYIEKQMINPPGYGVVTGTCMSSTMYGKPIPGLTAQIVGMGISNVTNGNGEFTLYNVPEGEHTFQLTYGSTLYVEKTITVTKGVTLDLGIFYLQFP
jgi:DNA-binding beta-propeller fold protein YncE